MEVPFLSSSAINREHYNLVQSVENAASLQQVDDLFLREVDVQKRRLGKQHPSSTECVESLILLLYCWSATTLGCVTRAALEFALPHAVTLAETGSTIKQKRIGYLFCMEIMHEDHDLQIMLVNTLRKDLEDLDIPRICLALDVLLMNCPEDAIPAVTPRLIDLLGHDSPHVKRKTLAVIRRVGLHEQNVLSRVKEKIPLRLADEAPYVVSAALSVLSSLARSGIITSRNALNLALQSLVDAESRRQIPKTKFAEVVGTLIFEPDEKESGIGDRVIQALFQMLTGAADTEYALVLECFRALSKCPADDLKPMFSSDGSRTLSIVRRLLGSPQPNIQYLCISCLLALDTSLWAGTTKDIPAAFDEGEVNIIMSLLDAPDRIVRKKTLQLLYRVDTQILALHLSQLLLSLQSASDRDQPQIAERVLEASAVHDTDGEEYAGRLRDVVNSLEVLGRDSTKGKDKVVNGGANLVFETVVEQVLVHLRNGSQEFCRAFVDMTARIPVSDAGPTLTLVIAASVCEYGALSSIPAEDLLRGLAGRLDANPPAIQEALLLAMLRITAHCDSVLPDILDQVRALHKISRSHIRRRCEQYISLSDRMPSLKRIAASAKSDTLPDFLLSLETVEANPQPSPQMRYKSPTANESISKSRSPTATGKLRYEAYDPPRPAPKLTRRRSSTASVHSHATSSHSGRSDSATSSHPPRGRPRRDSGGSAVTDGSEDGLSRTLTPGDLALAAHEPNFTRSASISKAEPRGEKKRIADSRSPPIEDLMTKTDLITLDSPFLTEPPQSLTEVVEQATLDFQSTWDALKDDTTSRGWCEKSPEEIVQRFEAMSNNRVTVIPLESGPYQGEIKVIMSRAGLLAALRLRPGEEGSSLWQLRCLDASMKAELKSMVETG